MFKRPSISIHVGAGSNINKQGKHAKLGLMSRARMLLIFYLLFAISNQADGQNKGFEYVDTSVLATTEDTGPDIEGDTTLYTHPITISADSVTAWKNDPRFAYMSNLDSLLKLQEQAASKEFQRLSESDRSLPGNGAPSALDRFLSSGITQAVFWGIAVIVIVFILYKLFINQGIFQKRSAPDAVKEKEETHYIPENTSEYDSLIRQSFKLGDFRMAVRYLFLKTLLQLTEKGLVQRSIEKTNYQYVQEITPLKRNEFAALVLKYEYVWYGHLVISREQFEDVEKSFINFYNKI